MIIIYYLFQYLDYNILYLAENYLQNPLGLYREFKQLRSIIITTQWFSADKHFRNIYNIILGS